MRFVIKLAVVASIALACAAPARVTAAMCADADNNGSVSVTDGVNMLRYAAGLSSPCVTQICDVNLDGAVSITDGVIALRQAAQLGGESTCAQAQVSEVISTTQAILETGIGIPGASGARVSNAAIGCPAGGEINSEPGRIDFRDCGIDAFRLNGTFFVTDSANGVLLTATQFSLVDVTTGESLSFSANLNASSDGSDSFVNGTLSFDGSALGSFTYTLESVLLAQDGTLTGGFVTVDVTRGIGDFARFQSLRLRFIGPVVLADVLFANNATLAVFVDNSTDGRGVCTECSTDDDCGAGLACFDCFPTGPKPCTGNVPRCTVNVQDVILECQDGYF